MTTRGEEEWRNFCRAVASETDPHRFSQLVEQLIQKLDEYRETLPGNQEHNPTVISRPIAPDPGGSDPNNP
jgi:hypothetical protein